MLVRVVRVIAVVLFCVCARAADDPRPVVGPGATKDDVINAYGWPNGQSQSGTKEILSYAQGEVVLENGRVERVNFSPDVKWQTPKPRPGPATATTRKLPEVPVDFWLTNFADAQREAQRRHTRILALFTGSDWSPPSRVFHDQVEYNPDFVNAFAGDFVFLKLDFPRGNPVPAKINPENAKLREKFNVTTYPTLLLLSSDGEFLAAADLSRLAPDTFRERVIETVRQLRDGTATKSDVGSTAAAAGPVPNDAADAARTAAGVAEPATAPASSRTGNAAGLGPAEQVFLTAGKMVGIAVALGALVVGYVLWRMWRQPQRDGDAPPLEVADRIDAAAGGMPSRAEMMNWPRDKLSAVTAGLAEFDDYAVHARPLRGDVDLELRKRGDVNPRALVCCSPGSAGVVTAKRLRELFASMTAEAVDNGWFVSPAGFNAEAREYAAAHRIVLVAADGLHNLMREVPPVSLPKVLART